MLTLSRNPERCPLYRDALLCTMRGHSLRECHTASLALLVSSGLRPDRSSHTVTRCARSGPNLPQLPPLEAQIWNSILGFLPQPVCSKLLTFRRGAVFHPVTSQHPASSINVEIPPFSQFAGFVLTMIPRRFLDLLPTDSMRASCGIRVGTVVEHRKHH